MYYSTQQMIDMSRIGLNDAQVGFMAEVLEGAIIRRTPVRSGDLRRSVQVEGFGDGTFLISMNYYGWLLNRGFSGFVMKELQGKTVPMNINGRTVFRKVTNVGAHQISSRDPKTGRIQAGNKPIAWRHPGVQPMRFVEQGIAEGLLEMAPAFTAIQIQRMMSQFVGEES